MKKIVKFLVLASGLLVVLLVVAGIAVKFYFNEARLRSLLLPPVREALGREVDISTISIDIFSGIKIDGLVVKEADGKTDFLAVKELGLSYSLLPLLEKRLEIGRIWLEKPVLNLWRNRDGSFNFSDLGFLESENVSGSDSHPTAASVDKALPLVLVVQRCDISQTELRFVDKSGELPAINLTADLKTKLDLGNLEPASIKVSGRVDFKLQAVHKSLKPVAAGTVEFDRSKIVYKIDVQQGNEACTLSGSLQNYLSSRPELVLDVNAAQLDLAYLAGLGQQLSAGGDTTVKPGAGKKQKAVSSAESKPQFTAQGKIDITKASYETYRIDDFFLRYKFDGVLLTLKDLGGKFADGLFSGAAEIKPLLQQPEFNGNFSLSGIKVDSLAAMAQTKIKDKLYGVGSGEFRFSGRGADAEFLKQTLSLEGDYSLQKAGMRNVPLTLALARILSLPELAELKMDEFAGNLRIRKGQVQLNSKWQGEYLNGSAVGDIGLDGGLKLPVDLILSKDLSEKLAQRYVWVKETFNENSEAEVSLFLDGSIAQPKMRLNSTKATKRLQKKLEEKLLQKLNEHMDGDKSASADKEEKVKPEDLLRQFLQK